MKKIGLNELRNRFLEFFQSKGHLVLPSFSLVPQDDPSILLINAGMTPLKPYFTGERKPPSYRIATCQKCIRTLDIEKVGLTSRHATFFEMLGNFSFGDYFKKEACSWAWEFLTEKLEIPVERLWVSIYQDDDEAYEIWNKIVGLPGDRIVRLGKEDNFWEHGTGPCGPCSEIYFDRGPDKGCGKPDCKAGCDCDRYIEVWNLVFTQFNKNEDGEYTKLTKKNIDTGMGLERLAVVMQDVDSLFEVDTIRNILYEVCKLSGKEYGKSEKHDVSIRVITDHIRGTVFMVSDGILPSNEGRGYVMRRLLRRAARHGRLLGIDHPFLYEVASVVIRESGEAYPDLLENADYIRKTIQVEEERFEATVDQGMGILDEMIAEVKEKGGKILPGEYAFRLHDTFGFPYDLTKEIAAENGLEVDEEGYKKMMEKQREKAREALKEKGASAWAGDAVEGIDPEVSTGFVGYETLSSTSNVLYLIKDGSVCRKLSEGEKGILIPARTPFYAESGGQVGDTGYIISETGTMRIDNCTKTPDGKYFHIGVVESGEINEGDAITLKVDEKRRADTARNHTVTHLLHRALKNVLGDHVQQAGSLVTPERLRFDFTHYTAMTLEEIEKTETEVNEKILEGLLVKTREMPLDEAKRLGAAALFGEKYGETVRVVSADDYSMELCGGTHLDNTSRAGLFKIISESSVAAGVRRIEGLTGHAAIAYYVNKEKALDKTAQILKTDPDECPRKAEELVEELKVSEREIESLKAKLIGYGLDDILSKAVEIEGFDVVTARLDDMDMQSLRNTGDRLREKIGSGVIILAGVSGGKVNLVSMATPDAVKMGVNAGQIVKEAAAAVGGGGGGRPDMAQAGGKDASKTDEALKTALEVVKKQLGA